MNNTGKNHDISGVHCDVNNCKYNADGCKCTAGEISVENRCACTKGETFCNTFCQKGNC